MFASQYSTFTTTSKILLLISLFSCSGAVVIPTIVNATGEYYINSHDGSSLNFSNNTITCSSETCIILCNNVKGCYDTVVEPSSAKHISITCTTTESCAFLYLWSTGSNALTSFSLHCAGQYSCSTSNIVILSVENADVVCSGYGGCQKTVLTLSAINEVQITCPNTWSCSSGAGVGRIQVTNARRATFEADGKWAFTNMPFLINNVRDVIVSCAGVKSCQTSVWNVGQSVPVQTYQHHCLTADACDYWKLYATVNKSLSITTEGAVTYKSGDRQIKCSSECLNTFNCGDYIYFHCGENAEAVPEPVGKEDVCSNCMCTRDANQVLYIYWTTPYWQVCTPTMEPTYYPTMNPIPTTAAPTSPTEIPTYHPSVNPTIAPTNEPTCDPTVDPTLDPTTEPTHEPTTDPTDDPTTEPTTQPTYDPTLQPSTPTKQPSSNPTVNPTVPTASPSDTPSQSPFGTPSQSHSTDSAHFMLFTKFLIGFIVLSVVCVVRI